MGGGRVSGSRDDSGRCEVVCRISNGSVIVASVKSPLDHSLVACYRLFLRSRETHRSCHSGKRWSAGLGAFYPIPVSCFSSASVYRPPRAAYVRTRQSTRPGRGSQPHASSSPSCQQKCTDELLDPVVAIVVNQHLRTVRSCLQLDEQRSAESGIQSNAGNSTHRRPTIRREPVLSGPGILTTTSHRESRIRELTHTM